MCGIFLALHGTRPVPLGAGVRVLLECRGPDSLHVVSYSGPDGESGLTGFHLTIAASVLALRGPNHVCQPYTGNYSGLRLCWNGEAWKKAGETIMGNDTAVVYGMLVDALRGTIESQDRQHEVLLRANRVSWSLSQVSGPYAFVLYDEASGILFWGRDFLGRRSLLTSVDADGALLISSVTDAVPEAPWSEVGTDGVHYIDLSDNRRDDSAATQASVQERFVVHKVPRYFIGDTDPAETSGPALVLPRLMLNKAVPADAAPLNGCSQAVKSLEKLLRSSLAVRVLSIPAPPPREPDAASKVPARLAILFSGGLDCTVLARLAHDLLPSHEPVDLLNVAFENPRVHKDGGDAPETYERCPDRITGRASLAELQQVCPGREWRFLAINIPYREAMAHKEKVVMLMHPHNTEMDLSISFALYFAARGRGLVVETGAEPAEYTTEARVLLSGLGADELFGGYQRHATAFERTGYAGLLDELDLDIGRLGRRNLGRDDRVISNWGTEVRYPYLDEELLGWALAVPVTDKCGFGEVSVRNSDADDGSAQLEPGKKVLRCMAWKLGTRRVAQEKKRAIQFGARTAKMESGKTKGTHLVT